MGWGKPHPCQKLETLWYNRKRSARYVCQICHLPLYHSLEDGLENTVRSSRTRRQNAHHCGLSSYHRDQSRKRGDLFELRLLPYQFSSAFLLHFPILSKPFFHNVKLKVILIRGGRKLRISETKVLSQRHNEKEAWYIIVILLEETETSGFENSWENIQNWVKQHRYAIKNIRI